jgi:hypothetical protein
MEYHGDNGTDTGLAVGDHMGDGGATQREVGGCAKIRAKLEQIHEREPPRGRSIKVTASTQTA